MLGGRGRGHRLHQCIGDERKTYVEEVEGTKIEKEIEDMNAVDDSKNSMFVPLVNTPFDGLNLTCLCNI